MSHEIFVIERKPELNDQEKHRAEYLRDKMVAAEEVGVKREATAIADELKTLERGHLIKTEPLTADELTIWNAWLPTIYSESGHMVSGRWTSRLSEYSFDRIPAPVLKQWQTHKKAGHFEDYEIWTPEVHRPDPILVGVNGNTRHLLARWGESDANLVTFDDIKRRLTVRWSWREILRALLAVGSVTLVFSLTLLVLFSESKFDSLAWPIWGIAMVVALACSLSYTFWRLGHDPLHLALKRHKTVERNLLPSAA